MSGRRVGGSPPRRAASSGGGWSEGEILERLLELAREVGLEVRVIRGETASGDEPTARSGVCTVRGQPWVVLCASDPAGARIGVLGDALRETAGATLEARYLPPLLRERIFGEPHSG